MGLTILALTAYLGAMIYIHNERRLAKDKSIHKDWDKWVLAKDKKERWSAELNRLNSLKDVKVTQDAPVYLSLSSWFYVHLTSLLRR